MAAVSLAPDGEPRCGWALSTPEYLAYHDHEWGFPVVDDRRLFEKICLEGFQAGLSWRTILAKRESFRAVFAGFDWNVVAEFGEGDVERLLRDSGIIRHRGKIEATINNAGRMVELVAREGSLAAYVWNFETADERVELASTSPASVAMSKDLKKRGWRFVGPTTVYAFMQAMGLVNDHATECVVRERALMARAEFTPPH
jgi:DNA-3-methyladenine glycosylase I